MAKQTMSATISEEQIKLLTKIAKERNTSRSQLLEECIGAWLADQLREQMKAGYLAQVHLLEETAQATFSAQRETLPPW